MVWVHVSDGDRAPIVHIPFASQEFRDAVAGGNAKLVGVASLNSGLYRFRIRVAQNYSHAAADLNWRRLYHHT